MFRPKLAAPLLVLALSLAWALPVAAADPNPATCLPNCYADNVSPAGGTGTFSSPWRYTDVNALRNLVRDAVVGKRPLGSLTVTTCDTAQPPKCVAVVYTYTRAGAATVTELGEVPNPTTGVPLPTPFVLGSVALLGALLLAMGMVTRTRLRRQRV